MDYVCAKAPGDEVASCVERQSAADQELTILRCDSVAAGGNAATPPPMMDRDSSDVGACCGAGHVPAWAVDGGWSECCGWDLDQHGQCCQRVDACGVCNGNAQTVDADGARDICLCLWMLAALSASTCSSV